MSLEGELFGWLRGAGGSAGGAVGGGMAEQFLVWGVLQQLLTPVMAPAVAEIQKLMFSAIPDVPLSAEVAASMVSRGLLDVGTAKDIANDNGIGGKDFEKLVKAATSAPDVSAVVAAFQRGLIRAGGPDGEQVSLAGALTDSGIRADWIPILEKLAVQIPSTAEVINAWLEGQITEGEAHKRYIEAGGDPTWFQTSYDANGQAPTPMQALELLNRGIIPERGTGPRAVSYEQAFLEGPWRNKWLNSFIALRYYFPPPRTVTAMYHQGQLTHDQAAHYLTAQGLDANLVNAYLSPGKAAHTAADKLLAKSEILTLYIDKLIPRTKALASLEKLKYTAADAELLLHLEDLKASRSQLTQGITHVRTLFQGGKIDAATAERNLVSLQIPVASAKDIVATWEIGASHTVKILTESQVIHAWYYKLIHADDALARLRMLGYDELDAWLLMAIQSKGAPKDVPRPAG